MRNYKKLYAYSMPILEGAFTVPTISRKGQSASLKGGIPLDGEIAMGAGNFLMLENCLM